MTTRPTTRIAALLAATTTLVGAFAACGDTNTTVINANCGAGTTLKDGVCVPVTDATTDTGVADTGAEVPDSSAPLDASSGDAAADAAEPDTEDPSPDDPCPVVGRDDALINCDAQCGAVSPRCAESVCSANPEVSPDSAKDLFGRLIRAPYSSSPYATTTIRLPRNPASIFGECRPKISENSYPDQRPRPKFMLAVLGSWSPAQYDSFCSPNTCSCSVSGVIGDPFNNPNRGSQEGIATGRYKVQSFRHRGLDARAGILATTPWEILLPSDPPTACPSLICEANQNEPSVAGLIFTLDRKSAAKNLVVALNPNPCR